jgi:hypothetical protein
MNVLAECICRWLASLVLRCFPVRQLGWSLRWLHDHCIHQRRVSVRAFTVDFFFWMDRVSRMHGGLMRILSWLDDHEQGCAQVQLLPQERPRCRLRRLRHHVHGGLRDGADLFLPAAQLARHVVALHPRRHHVLLILVHCRRPLVGANHIR